MGMQEQFLSQDIDEMDILGGEAPDASGDLSEMFSDVPRTEEEVTETPVEEVTSEETTLKETETEQLTEDDDDWSNLSVDELLSKITASEWEVTDKTGDATESLDTATALVEDLQDKTQDSETEQVLREVYQELIKTDGLLQASIAAQEVKDNMIRDLQSKLSETEMASYGERIPDDEDVKMLNKMFLAAESGSTTAQTKIKDVLERLYERTFGESMEQTKTNKEIDNASVNKSISYNEATMPSAPQVSESIQDDPNDLTSIFN